jgi:hypothetical protein
MKEVSVPLLAYAHCALDTQAWTDLVSNITSLSPTTIEDDPRPWLGWGQARAQSDRLSVFLHEATHHWCFTSPVAFAIAGLTLRARVGIARALQGEEHMQFSILRDLISADTAVALLRPLAEGLALFAEFDATSRLRSKAISPILQSIFQFFVDLKRSADLFRRLPAEVAIAQTIAEALYDLRTNEVTLNRKASLLLQPFSLNAGGYLPGYLAVKSLWRAACRKHFLLANETDLFLMYLRSYIYDDWGFVATLLSEELDEIRSAEAIVNHLNGRIRQWDELSDQDFSEYENSLAADSRSRPSPLPGLGVSDSAAGSGKQRLNNLTSELVEAAIANDSMTTGISAWSANILQRRQFMNLASVPVQVCTNSNGLPEVQWRRTSMFTPTRSDFVAEPKDSVGDAHLEIVFALIQDRFERAAVVHRDDKVLVCAPIGMKEHASDTRESVLRAFLRRPLVVEAEKAMRALVENVAGKSWFQIPMDHCKSQIDSIVDEFFKDLSLRFARDYDSIDNCAAKMSQKGLRPILNSSSLIKGLALLGLATSLNPQRIFIEEIFKKHGLSLSQTLDQLSNAYESWGYPPRIGYVENTLFTTV